MIFNVGFARQKNGGCAYANMSEESFKKSNEILDSLIERYKIDSEKNLDIAEDKIYFNLDGVKNRHLYPVIGADMFCASWYENRK